MAPIVGFDKAGMRTYRRRRWVLSRNMGSQTRRQAFTFLVMKSGPNRGKAGFVWQSLTGLTTVTSANVGALLPLRERTLNRIAACATEDRFTPQRASDQDQRTVQEIMDEADPPCSRTQVLVNNLLIIIVSTAFLIAFVWGFSS
jgi:hypothetical protein